MHASISPGRVLTRETNREVANLGVRRWSSLRSDCWLGPVAGHEVAMPADHGRGLHYEEHLGQASAIERPGQDREDRAVGLGELGA